MFDLFSLFWRGSEGLALLATIFWIWVLVDCIIKEPSEGNDKVAWTIFIIFVPLFGALLYYFVRRPERIKTVGR
ncbi:MAG TPA: PLD nuclease N-terminal domain-containing protein [Ktedonobacteraceae bacterium]|jgi:hypothetical protein